ncbi:MAG: FixH family protein [Flavobacteriaceae bacterium]|nr:FixH family protein [Flavobacteriaceae bacterium]
MKINWGTGIVIAFALFISFILYFVIKSAAPENRYYFDEENYYKSSLKHQEVIDKLENTKTLSSKVLISKSENGYVITFPEEINNKTTGTVSFFRPSTNVLDFQLPLVITNHKMNIEHENLIPGKWNVTIDFELNSTEYLVKQSLSY